MNWCKGAEGDRGQPGYWSGERVAGHRLGQPPSLPETKVEMGHSCKDVEPEMTGEVCIDGGWKLGLQSLELGFHNNPLMAESFTYKTMMCT